MILFYLLHLQNIQMPHSRFVFILIGRYKEKSLKASKIMSGISILEAEGRLEESPFTP